MKEDLRSVVEKGLDGLASQVPLSHAGQQAGK